MLTKKLYITESTPQPETGDEDDEEIVEKILIVIVLYNTSLIDSSTFRTLNDSFQAFSPTIQADLMICDNSVTPQVDINSIDDYKNFNIYYLHDSSNPGISLSYNRAVELASSKQKSWIMVFDQDTELPTDAIEKYIYGLKKWPDYSIYAPKVYSDNILLSPCRYYIYRGSPYRKINAGVHTLQGKNIINSGLIISIDAYTEAGGYDENVWLYYSDFVFFNRLKKVCDKFFVLDLSVGHDISSSNYDDISFALNRFTYYCQGAKAASNSSGGFVAYVGHGVTVGLRSLLMCRRFKSTEFLKVFLKNFILSTNEN